jgi:hypothetical protein
VAWSACETLRVASTAESWLSKMRAGPVKVRWAAAAAAVLTMHPSSAMLP